MCFGLRAIRKVDVSDQPSSTCSTCSHVSDEIWFQLKPCMGQGREICIVCANLICKNMGWKYFDQMGERIDPPPPPPLPELASTLIDIDNIWKVPNVVILVHVDGMAIGQVDFDHYLAIHIRQSGVSGKSTNSGNLRNNRKEIIEDIVKDHKNTQILLEFKLGKTKLTPTLIKIKEQLDRNEKIYNNAMTEITNIQHKYCDKFGYLKEVTLDTDQSRLKELSQIYTDHLYYPQIGEEFVANLKISGHSALDKLPKNLVWRITQIDLDYEDPKIIESVTISGLL